jgi:hypothetical protein
MLEGEGELGTLARGHISVSRGVFCSAARRTPTRSGGERSSALRPRIAGLADSPVTKSRPRTRTRGDFANLFQRMTKIGDCVAERVDSNCPYRFANSQTTASG